MDQTLADSFAYCEQLARAQAGNFYPAFRILPTEQRLAMCALYAFMRIADDLSDEPGPVDEKRRQLAGWRQGLHDAVVGKFDHPSHAALHEIMTRYRIPVRYLEDVIDGVEMDLEPVRYETFADLRVYCYRVASAVGLACIHIWGFSSEQAKVYAEAAGIAFQLTNILRDLGEDAARARVYLPHEDLRRFGYSSDQLKTGSRTPAFHEMMKFEVARARGFYQSAWPLVPLLEPPGRAVFLMMARTYRALLDEMEKRDFDVFSRRVSVGSWRKMWFALRSLPVRWGW